ncbi:hypothetical protein B0H16DRAFT_1475500 [Mycena metata]|uniref:Uncharacterized protein n=1 Tax=Mycena metata TaxID=1033252 RepID=A0AAD7HED3_9AGAR|nr:hypothetical protein B0H16DRAFT_1475500 [Mycena metata]
MSKVTKPILGSALLIHSTRIVRATALVIEISDAGRGPSTLGRNGSTSRACTTISTHSRDTAGMVFSHTPQKTWGPRSREERHSTMRRGPIADNSGKYRGREMPPEISQTSIGNKPTRDKTSSEEASEHQEKGDLGVAFGNQKCAGVNVVDRSAYFATYVHLFRLPPCTVPGQALEPGMLKLGPKKLPELTGLGLSRQNAVLVTK